MDYSNAGSAEAWPVTASATGTLSALVVYIDPNTTGTQFDVGLYTNNSSNKPGTRLTHVVFTPQSGWNTVAVPTVSITSGVKYWIATLGLGSGRVYVRDGALSGCTSYSSSQTNLTQLPTTYTSGSGWRSCPVSIYGIGGGSPPPPPPPPISVTISPTSASLLSGQTQQFTATVSGTTTTAVNWSCTGCLGTVSSTGLYTAPSVAASDTVTVTSQADATKSASATVAVSVQSGTIFFDDFLTSPLSSAWWVIQRHGEYSQNETECNTAGAVTVPNGELVITTSVGPATCGDFYPDGSVRTPPSSWPYVTGDVQWNTFSFLYGTLEIRGRMPLTNTTRTWPAYWLLGTNCQATNKYSGDTGFSGCPNILTPTYDEIDLDECFQGGCRVNVYHDTSGQSCMYPNEDTNYHVFTMIWQPNSLIVKRDGQQICKFTQGVPANPMFLIIQNQTGGVGGTPNNSALPTTMAVDYVRVTQP